MTESLKKHIPNSISILRILLSPVFIYYLYAQCKYVALSILLVGAFTDFLDGYIARKLKVTSKCGEILDPIADKVFINTVIWGIYMLSSASSPSPILLSIAVILSSRDLFLLISGACILFFQRKESKNIEIKAVYISKICTTLLFIFCCLSLVIERDSVYVIVLGYAVILNMIGTIIVYVRRYMRARARS